jgi:hypothetical protein
LPFVPKKPRKKGDSSDDEDSISNSLDEDEVDDEFERNDAIVTYKVYVHIS